VAARVTRRRGGAAALRRAGGRASHGPRHSSWDSRAPSRAHALHPEQRSRFLLDRQLAAAALAAAVHGVVLVAPEETALLPSTVDASLDPTRLRCFADFSTSRLREAARGGRRGGRRPAHPDVARASAGKAK